MLLSNTSAIVPTVASNSTTDGSKWPGFDFDNNPGLVFVLVSCSCASFWLLFISFYHSRVLGCIVTRLLNRFTIKNGYIYVGSFSVSLLSGKIMFRDVKYITKDFSIKIVDGLAIFRWWIRFDATDRSQYQRLSKNGEISEPKSCRLSLQFNGLEFHLFNRSELYKKVENALKRERYGDASKSHANPGGNPEPPERTTEPGLDYRSLWRELVPVVQYHIRQGKVALGNRLTPTTLWMHFNKGHGTYSMPDAPSSIDIFSHLLCCTCEDVRVLLSKSPGYQSAISEAPRFMGQGFVVLHAGVAKFVYQQDEPGLVPTEGSFGNPDSDPYWGLTVVFAKPATMTYGPWVDKQRIALQKFFFPNDFQEHQVTKPVSPGERRLHTGLDLKVEFKEGLTMEVLFSKNEETSALHVVAGNMSSLHYYQPWSVHEYGYTSNVVAHLQQVQLSSSMQFRNLLQCESLEVAANMAFPRIWNQTQHWTCEFWLNKCTCYFLYQHKNFFNDLSADWTFAGPPDIATFIPYQWEFNLYFRDFEIICLVNEHNWIDCVNEDENSELAVCGETLDINFVLPFTHFMPEVEEMKFFFRGETVMLRSFLPESNTLRKSVIALARSSDQHQYPNKLRACSLVTEGGNEHVDGDQLDDVDHGLSPEDMLSNGWRGRTGSSHGWIDVWSVPVLILNIFYKYHPIPYENDMTREIRKKLGVDCSNVEPSSLPPDIITVELEAGPSAIRQFGFFWRQFFVGLKENYFGTCQTPFEFNAQKEMKATYTKVHHEPKDTSGMDTRIWRPFEAHVTVVLLDIQTELSTHTSERDPPSPQAFTDCVTFEMHKTFRETRLVLAVNPVSIIVSENVKRSRDHSHLSRGFLTLSGLKFRGHAMFSDFEVPAGTDTVEYAWLMEIACGHLRGKVTPLQLHAVLLWLETFGFHLSDAENAIIPSSDIVLCQHNMVQGECNKSEKNGIPCPTESDLKYRVARFSIESVNVYLAEEECALRFQASPVRLAFCNAHGPRSVAGLSFFINEVAVRQFVQHVNVSYMTAELGGKPGAALLLPSNSWVEVGALAVGRVTGDVLEKDTDELGRNQHDFIVRHDRLTKRLWFLWSPAEIPRRLSADERGSNICGCVGGCDFFDSNVNGVNFFTTQQLNVNELSSACSRSGSFYSGRKGDLGRSVKLHLKRKSGTLAAASSKSASDLRASSSQGVHLPPYLHDGIVGSNMADVIDFPSWDSAGVDASRKVSFGVAGSGRSAASTFAFHDPGSIVRTSDEFSMLPALQRADSEMTFYSCTSNTSNVEDGDMDLTGPDRLRTSHPTLLSNISMKSGASTESFVSAVMSHDDLLHLDETDAPPKKVPLIPPGLLHMYGQCLHTQTCINWRQGVPHDLRKRFSLINNLKVIVPPGHNCDPPNIPLFGPNLEGAMAFEVLSSADETFQPLVDHAGIGNKQGRNGKYSFVAVRVHEQVNVMLTPLLLDALNRYSESVKAIDKCLNVCSMLDEFHLGCIAKSKEKFIQDKMVDILHSKVSRDVMQQQLNELVPKTVISVHAELPQLNIVTCQISSELYSEQSSLSGQCGSEFSYEADAKNGDLVLYAMSLGRLDGKIHFDCEHPVLLSTKTYLLNRHSVSKSELDVSALGKLEDYSFGSRVGLHGSLGAGELQVQHVDGTVGRRNSNVTCIPITKSAVRFSIRQGKHLASDKFFGMTVDHGKFPGNVILECGVRQIEFRAMRKVSLERSESSSAAVASDRLLDSVSYSKSRPEDVSLDASAKSNVQRSESAAEKAAVSRSKQYADTKEKFHSSQSSLDPVSAHSRTSVEKVYTLVDIDSGDIADFSDNDQDDERVNLLFSSDTDKPSLANYTKPSVKKREDSQKANRGSAFVTTVISGCIEVQNLWTNLAAPQKLHVAVDKDINLVTTLLPALRCWIPTWIRLQNTMVEVATSYQSKRLAVLACCLGQALPENGRLLKKHNITTKATDLARFLQEEYSSQLLYVLRRQTLGARLVRLEEALKEKYFIPGVKDLERGVHALLRQWKCVIIGAEGGETFFASSQFANAKRPVVGRGLLTAKDLQVLLQGSNPTDSDATKLGSSSASAMSPVSKSDVTGTDFPMHGAEKDVANVFETSKNDEAGALLESSSDSESNEHDHKPKEQTLYDWMSNTPVYSPINSPRSGKDSLSYSIKSPEDLHPRKPSHMKSPIPDTVQDFRKDSPMVSRPTRGMQLAEAAEVFSPLFSSAGMKYSKLNGIQTKNIVEESFKVHKFVVNLIPSEARSDLAESEFSSTLPTGGVFTPPLLEMAIVKVSVHSEHLSPVTGINRTEDAKLDAGFCPATVCVSIDVDEAMKHLDFGLVRLLLQLSETMDGVREEKHFAQRSSPMINDASKRGYNLDRLAEDLSNPNLQMPKCWRSMYNVLNLYTLPPDKSASFSARSSQAPSIPVKTERMRIGDTVVTIREETLHFGSQKDPAKHLQGVQCPPTSTALLQGSSYSTPPHLTWCERFSLVITCALKKAYLSAHISGLELDVELKELTLSHLKSIRCGISLLSNVADHEDTVTSSSAHLERIRMYLAESVEPKKQTVMRCKVRASRALHSKKYQISSQSTQRSFLFIGPISAEIPEHPGILRSIAARFTQKLQKNFIEFDNYKKSRRVMPRSNPELRSPDIGSIRESLSSSQVSSTYRLFSAGLLVKATLLPSLTVSYKIARVTGLGNLKGKAKFSFHLPHHQLSFDSKINLPVLPAATVVELPPIKVHGHYMEMRNQSEFFVGDESVTKVDLVTTHGYLHSVISIGTLKQALSTDLLNHLIYLQKGFMKEVTEVVLDVEQNEPVPLWKADSEENVPTPMPLLYSVQINLEGISITASTPSSTAIRLETGVLSLEVSNQNPETAVTDVPSNVGPTKLYGRAQVEISVSLGLLSKAHVPDSESELDVYAQFRTKLGLSNAPREGEPEVESGVVTASTSGAQTTILVTLNKPQLFVIPAAVDKGVLVYLHYKNAYDYWNKQRLEFSAEFQTAAHNLLGHLPQQSSAPQLSGLLFLQLNVFDLGVCIPLMENSSAGVASGTGSFAGSRQDHEQDSALLVTMNETSITCCSSGSFVSMGRFDNFCTRFAESFDPKKDEWIINVDGVMNTATIREGTYRLCSKTIAPPHDDGAFHPSKWVMTIFWKMCGLIVHVDHSIGQRLSALSMALTTIAGESDVADLSSVAEADGSSDVFEPTKKAHLSARRHTRDDVDLDEVDATFPDAVLPSPSRHRSVVIDFRSLEYQLWEQTQKVNELKRSNASGDVVSREMKALQDIESALSSEFFRDVKRKFRRGSRRPTLALNQRLRAISFPNKPSYRPGSPGPVVQTTGRRRHSSIDRSSVARFFKGHSRRSSDPVRESKGHVRTASVPVAVQVASDDGAVDSSFQESNEESGNARGNIGDDYVHVESDVDDPVRMSSVKVKFTNSTLDVSSTASDVQRPAAVTMPTAMDFELNLVVDIESGRCVLHTNNDKEKDNSSDDLSPLSASQPRVQQSRRISDQTGMVSSKRYDFRQERIFSEVERPLLRPLRPTRSLGLSPGANHTQMPEDTVILIPGVNVRVNYLSSNVSDRKSGFGSSSGTDATDSLGSSTSPEVDSVTAKAFQKAAGLNAFVSLQPLPREMILRPSLLDFLEKALEPIVMPGEGKSTSQVLSDDDDSGGGGSVVSSSGSELYSFPVNVVVFIRVEPSDIRFSCLPVSKVECLLRIPSLDFVITSTPQPKFFPQRTTNSNSPKRKPQLSKKPVGPLSSGEPVAAKGGLSFTVCLSRFSFCIFHPYGKQFGVPDARGFADPNPYVGRKSEWNRPEPISGRKDSLSLNVEFIKFNLFRQRIKQQSLVSKRKISTDIVEVKTVVKISGIMDIGSASFNYDMRRLTEILDVPKAWSKRGLYRRIFLGKEATLATQSTMSPATNDARAKAGLSTNSPLPGEVSTVAKESFADRLKELDMPVTPKSVRSSARKSYVGHHRGLSGSAFLGNLVGTPFLPRASTVGSRNDLQLKSDPTGRLKKPSDLRGSAMQNLDTPSLPRVDVVDADETDAGSTAGPPPVAWETMVVLALNMSRLDISTNMGNVMGQAIWSTNELHARSRLQMNNSGVKNVKLHVGVRQGSCEAHGGIIGGYAEIQEILATGAFEQNLGSKPCHVAQVGMKGGEIKVDYMGMCIIMATLSSFASKVRDSWILPQFKASGVRSFSPRLLSVRSQSDPSISVDPVTTEIHLHGECSWEEFQVIMSRSTTSDFFKMVAKLQDFFAQQRRNSARVLSSFRPAQSLDDAGRSLKNQSAHFEADAQANGARDGRRDGLKYQHWVEVLNGLPRLRLVNQASPISDKGIIVGGSLKLKGDFLSLACFHGSNFRSQNWALFTLQEPLILFTTETRGVERSCQVMRGRCVQEVLLCLGHEQPTSERRHSTDGAYDFYATVRKVSRGRRNPPSLGAPVQEWLVYVNTTSDGDLPSSSRKEKKASEKRAHSKQSGGLRKVSFAPKYRYENDSEVIFGLPNLSLQLTTEHDMPMSSRVASVLIDAGTQPAPASWSSTVPSPHVVETSFVSRFGDSFNVGMDVSLYLFLHDLILGYMREKDSALAGGPSSREKVAMSERPVGTVSSDERGTASGQEKYRVFRSKAWVLEPRIRLLSWAGARIDPVSIDWVLEKLGFMHAKLTIPKWVQRGCMDPMDRALAIGLGQLLAFMKESQQESE